MTVSREAVARSKQLVAINSSSSLSAILRYAVLICNDVYYDEACGYIFGYFLGILLVIFGGSRRLVGDKLLGSLGFPTRFLPIPKNRVTRSFSKPKTPVFGCL